MTIASDGTSFLARVPLLRTKLHRPPVTVDHVPRPQLVEKLSAQRDRRFVLVSAPAGFGKSTLLSAWLAQEARPGAWLSLDVRDNDLATFIAYFVAAVQTIFPDAGRTTQAMVNAPTLPPLSALAGSLINELDEVDEPFILALDDYYAITNEAIHDLLAELLNHPPRPLCLALASRYDPPFALSHLRARSDVIEIRSHDLRFSLDEVSVFVRQTLGLNVDASSVVALRERTEGWIAGLRLATISLRVRGYGKANVDALPMPERYALDYLADEVLAQQPLVIQEFLLKTSILERFSAPLCETIIDLGDTLWDGQACLDWVAKSDLFVVRLDERGQWYRYHHLFQELLQQQLASRYSRDEIEDMHRRASASFAADGHIDEALVHALAADDADVAAQLVEQHRMALINQGQFQRLEQWLRLLPRNVMEGRPALLLAQAWIAWQRTQTAEVIAFVDRAEPLIAQLPMASETASSLQGEVDCFRSYQYYRAGDAACAKVQAERALQKSPYESWSVRELAFMYLARSCQATGDLKRAHEVVGVALSEARSLSNNAYRMGILGTECFLHWNNADLHGVMDSAGLMLALGERSDAREFLYTAHYFMGIVEYQRNELAQAERHFNAVLEQRYQVQLSILIHSAFALALSYQARNRPDEARKIAEAVPTWLGELDNPFKLPFARAFQAELALRQGRLAEANQWAARVQPDALIPLPMFYAPPLTLAKALVAQNTRETRQTAAAQLAELRDWAERTCDIHVLIQVLVLEAVLHDAEGDLAAALLALERAILLAQPGGFIRVFADAGPRMGELLKQLHRRNIARSYVERILAALMPSRPVTAVAQSALIEPLTERELDVLKLMAEGLSAKEIAMRLVISPGTVKQHTHHIFQKLLVNNRREAVKKAIALDLLPPA